MINVHNIRTNRFIIFSSNFNRLVNAAIRNRSNKYFLRRREEKIADLKMQELNKNLK